MIKCCTLLIYNLNIYLLLVILLKMLNLLSKALNYVLEENISNYESDSSCDETECEEKQCKPFEGVVTSVYADYGMIDQKIYFPMKVCVPGYIPKVNDFVSGTLSKTHSNLEWTVIQLTLSENWEVDSETSTLSCQIDLTDKKCVIFQVESVKSNEVLLNSNCYFDMNDVEYDFQPAPGDWINATLVGDSNSDQWKFSKITSLRRCRIEGEITSVTKFHGIINNEVYFSNKVCKNGYHPNLGDLIHADVIESDQNKFSWRAINIMPSIINNKLNSWKNKSNHDIQARSKFTEELMSDKCGIVVTEKLDFGFVKYASNLKYISAMIRNKSVEKKVFEKCTIQGDSNEHGFNINSINVIHSNGRMSKLDIGSKIVLLPNTTICCNISFVPKHFGINKQLLICKFNDFSIGRYVCANVQDDKQLLLNATQSYVKKDVGDRVVWNLDDKLIVPGEKVRRPKNFVPSKLPQYGIPRKLIEVIDDKQDLLSEYRCLLEELSFNNYKYNMSLLLHLEEVQQQRNMREFDLKRVCLRPSGEYLALQVPGLAERRPSLLIGDRVILSNPGQSNNLFFEGYIHQVFISEVLLRFNEEFHTKYFGEDYNVRFELNRTTMRRCHKSVEIAINLLGKDVLFPTILDPKVPNLLIAADKKKCIKSASMNSLPKLICDKLNASGHQCDKTMNGHVKMQKNRIMKFPDSKKRRMIIQSCDNKVIYINNDNLNSRNIFDLHCTISNSSKSRTEKPKFIVPNIYKNDLLAKRAIKNQQNKDQSVVINWSKKNFNEEQKSAVKRILAGSSRPVPYVVFGPPGTGKTVTIVEAILQIFKFVSSSRILACTPSNSAADLIIQRLHESGLIPTYDMIRMNSFQRSLENLPANVKRYCDDELPIEVIARKRIIVCTCNSAGKFYSLGLKEGHFTHVFVDEAGQATEPECLIPVSLAAGPDCQVVLSGDPLQLGPVIQSTPAKLYGLQSSFLERLMNRPLYRANSKVYKDHGNYNPLLVTKLLRSYRCHECILKFYSKTFYDDELIPCVDNEIISKFCGWKHLKNPDFPVLFHSVVGEDMREGDSPSWFNPAEVMQCIYYLRKLLDDGINCEDIGIITPYKKQVEKIRFMISTLEIPEIKVGSVEEFQGQERLVIILSTVRSTVDLLSFDLKHSLGFLQNSKRFNVAISRSQALLIVIGNSLLLNEDQFWSSFIQYCKDNHSFVGNSLMEEDLANS